MAPTEYRRSQVPSNQLHAVSNLEHAKYLALCEFVSNRLYGSSYYIFLSQVVLHGRKPE